MFRASIALVDNDSVIRSLCELDVAVVDVRDGRSGARVGLDADRLLLAFENGVFKRHVANDGAVCDASDGETVAACAEAFRPVDVSPGVHVHAIVLVIDLDVCEEDVV